MSKRGSKKRRNVLFWRFLPMSLKKKKENNKYRCFAAKFFSALAEEQLFTKVSFYEKNKHADNCVLRNNRKSL